MSMISPHAEWEKCFSDLKSVVPEAFTSDNRALNLIGGDWQEPGFGRHYESPVDGRSIGRIPMIRLEMARRAVKSANAEVGDWASVDLDERRRRVLTCCDALRKNRQLIALLLI